MNSGMNSGMSLTAFKEEEGSTRFLRDIFELELIMKEELYKANVALNNKDTRAKIVAASIEEEEDNDSSSFFSASSSASNARLQALLNRTLRDAGFIAEEQNILLIAAARHLLNLRLVLDGGFGGGSGGGGGKEEEAWLLVNSAEGHAKEHEWPPSMWNELHAIKSMVSLRRSMVLMESGLEQGQARMVKVTGEGAGEGTGEEDGEGNGEGNGGGVDDIDRRNVDVSLLDKSLRFALEVQNNLSGKHDIVFCSFCLVLLFPSQFNQ